MKKLGISIALAVLVAGAAAAYFMLQQGPKAGPLETLVPDDALMYLYSQKTWQQVSQLKESAFFRKVSSSPGYTQGIEPFLRKTKQQLPYLPQLLEQEVGVAMFTFGKFETLGKAGKGLSEAYNLGDFLVLARIDRRHFGPLKKAFADYYLSFSPSKYASTFTYKGVKVTSYPLPHQNITIYYCFAGDVVLVSNEKEIVVKGIDLYKKASSASLSGSQSFRNAFNKVSHDGLCAGYINHKRYYEQLLAYYDELGAASGVPMAALMKMNPFSRMYDAWDAGAFYLGLDASRSGIVYQGVGTLQQGSNDTQLQQLFPPGIRVDKAALKLVPARAVAFGAVSLQPREWWKYLRISLRESEKAIRQQVQDKIAASGGPARAVQIPSFEEMYAKMERTLGFSVEKDFLPQLGTTLGAAMTGPVNPGPQIIVFVELKNPARAGELFQQAVKNSLAEMNGRVELSRKTAAESLDAAVAQGKVTAQYAEQVRARLATLEPAAVEEEEFLGARIFSLHLPGNAAKKGSFTYSFQDKYLLVSFSPEPVRAAITASRKAAEGITAAPVFQQVADKVQQEYSGILFMNPANMASMFAGAAPYQAMLRQQGKGAGVKEMLSALEDIQGMAFTNTVTDQGMEFSGYCKVEGL